MTSNTYVTAEQAKTALDNLDDYARMANIDPVGARSVLERFIEQVKYERLAANLPVPHTMAGFRGGYIALNKGRTPTNQEIWDAGVRSGIERAREPRGLPPAPSTSVRGMLRGETSAFVHLDEAAFYPMPKTLVADDCYGCGECPLCKAVEKACAESRQTSFSSGVSSCPHCDYGSFPCNQNCIVAGD